MFSRQSMLVVVALALAACASEGAEPGAGGAGPGPTSSSSTGGQAGAGGLQVLVTGELGAPVEGAGVAVDLVGGERSEAVTDAQGVAALTGFDLATIASVIAHKDGRQCVSVSRGFLDQTADIANEPLRISMYEVDPKSYAGLVNLSGMAMNMANPSNTLLVGTTLFDDSVHADIGASWSIYVAPSSPFTLLALELDVGAAPPQGNAIQLFGWYRADSPGVTMDGTMNIDFAMSAQPLQVSGTFPKPTDPQLESQGNGLVRVLSLDASSRPAVLVGLSTLTQASQSGSSIDYQVSYLDLGQPLLTGYEMVSTFTESVVWQDGPPPAGTVTADFFAPPQVTASGGQYEPIVWVPEPGRTYDRHMILVRSGNQYKARHLAGGSETQTAMPPLPSTSNAAAFWPGSWRQLAHCADLRNNSCYQFSAASVPF